MCYVVSFMPRKLKRDNKIEIFNEVCLKVCIMFMIVLSLSLESDQAAEMLGYIMMAITSINIVFNMAKLAYFQGFILVVNWKK